MPDSKEGKATQAAREESGIMTAAVCWQQIKLEKTSRFSCSLSGMEARLSIARHQTCKSSGAFMNQDPL